MQTAQSYNNIKVEATKLERSPFPLNHDNNTTATFGLMQPLVCRLIPPNSKATMAIDPIVMMAPMVAPTVGRMQYETYSCFVGMSDLLQKSFSPFLTKKTYSRASNVALQMYLPWMQLCDLSLNVLVGSHITLYKRTYKSSDGSTKTFVKASSNEIQSLKNYWTNQGWFLPVMNESSYPNYSGTGLDARALGLSKQFTFPISNDSSFSDANADYVPTAPYSYRAPSTIQSANLVIEANISGVDYAFAIRFSSFGKQFRKIMLGLGYQINLHSTTQVCVLPLFAYYKAYYDTFGLTLYSNWESTFANSILVAYDNGSYNFDVQTYSFKRFVNDLVMTYYTDAQDYISAHQRTDSVSSSMDGFINNVIYVDPNGPSVTTQDSSQNSSPVDTQSKSPYINKVNHTQVDATLLMRLYRSTNRNTIAGRRIEQLLRVGGYGKFVDECKSYFIGRTITELQVGRGVATSDGVNTVTGTNNVMGEYYGVGFGHDEELKKKKMDFENDEFGYWITFGGVVPKSGYCQGVDLTLLAIKPEDMYSADYDGIGYEASPKLVVKGDEDWTDVSNTNDDFAASFGLLPRETRWKQVLNKMNGDFSLRGVRDGWMPFVLDKFIDADDGNVTEVDSQGNIKVTMSTPTSQLPIAGNAWRYNSRYPWLSTLQRLFTRYNQDYAMFAPAMVESEQLAKDADFAYLYNEDDNFLCFNSIDLILYARMLPISESYGTMDEDGHSNLTLSKA